MRCRATVWLALAGLCASGAVHADAQEGQSYFTLMPSFVDDDKEAGLDDGVSGGQIGIGHAIDRHWNVEGFFMFASPDGFPGQDESGVGVDLQLHFNRESRFTPYVFLGAGYLAVERDDGRNRDGAMIGAGAGFLADIFGSSNIALRTEYRLRSYDLFGGEDLRDHMFSLGLQFPFGRAEPPDSDGDGVADPNDRCPGTPAGTPVDGFGCERDSDGDGVGDTRDRCPNTPAGMAVDADGCPPDSDGDGVRDDADRCPNTPRGARVDAQGCELDSDGDGVVDRLDRCPDTRAGARVDVRGCEIREQIELPGVNFETNSDRLVAGTEAALDDAAATLKRYPDIYVEVAGHTDSDGAAEYNEGLSLRRALTVRDYLVRQGVEAERLSVRGYGESQPIADNSTPEGKARNRRVVLRILER
ncbi:MAG TPA: OmpA family protein [Woeseiaceae bacterium]|nr:OmpA family protein [Woeseiaceae bacterium]